MKRALFGLFRGAVSKDVVSRAWRKVKVDWDAWCSRGLADEDIVRLILDGTVIKTRLDRKATNISVLAAIGAEIGEGRIRQSFEQHWIGLGAVQEVVEYRMKCRRRIGRALPGLGLDRQRVAPDRLCRGRREIEPGQ